MTKPLQNEHIKCNILSELMSFNYYEISTYEEMHYELNNVQNVLGILLKNIPKSVTIVSIRTSIPNIA